MGKIIISRVQEWNNSMRRFGIYVDGRKIGTIANGEIKTFDVPDGPHSAKIDWCGSREVDFSISGDEKKYFRLSGYKLGKFIIIYALFVVILNSVANRLWKIDYLFLLFIPALFIIIYYLSIGRNNYLQLKQTDSW